MLDSPRYFQSARCTGFDPTLWVVGLGGGFFLFLAVAAFDRLHLLG
jgi:hypothetical protein